MKVPEALLSGNHSEIEKWRRREALKATLLKRPDLLETADLTDEDRTILEELKRELGSP
jgi:tRNA (guanine37-N1)-methyltransferase